MFTAPSYANDKITSQVDLKIDDVDITSYSSTVTTESYCYELIDSIKAALGETEIWYDIFVGENDMDTAELNTLLNCIATPWIGADDESSDLFYSPEILTFKNWRPSDRGSLNEAVLERLYESMTPELDSIGIYGMQDAQGSNFKD